MSIAYTIKLNSRFLLYLVALFFLSMKQAVDNLWYIVEPNKIEVLLGTLIQNKVAIYGLMYNNFVKNSTRLIIIYFT